MIVERVNVQNDLSANANRLMDGINQLVGCSINSITLNFIRPTTIVPQGSSRTSYIDSQSMLIRLSCEAIDINAAPFSHSTVRIPLSQVSIVAKT